MRLLCRCQRWLRGLMADGRRALGAALWVRPVLAHSAGAGRDLARTKGQLLAENALLRQQLLVLRRSVAPPAMAPADRALLVLLAGRVPAWRQALRIVRPDTLLRWHRAGFRAHWRRRSRPGPGRPPLPGATAALIRRLADENPLWGAERIQGELQKLGLRVAKRTIQRYLPAPRAPRPRGQTRATFLRNHAPEIWACDFLSVTDLLFRPLYAFVVIELATWQVVHVNATRHPSDAWVAQQLREAAPFAEGPRFLIRDNDAKYGQQFDQAAAVRGIPGPARPPSVPHGPMRRASGSSAACAGNASITCSSSASATWRACCARTWRTATGSGRTRDLGKRYPSRAATW